MLSLIICKDLTKEFDPVNPTYFFVPSDQAIICLAILDSIDNPSRVEFKWTYQEKVIVYESKMCVHNPKKNVE